MDTVRRSRFAAVPLVFLLLLVGAPGESAVAQEDPVAEVEPGAGIVLPTGDIGDLYDPGPAFEVGLSRWIAGPVHASVDFDLGLLSGIDDAAAEIPDLRTWSFTGGFEVDVVDRRTSPWRVTPEITAGAVRFDSDAFDVDQDGRPDGLSETYFTASGGLRAGRSISDRVGVYLSGTAQLLFADEEDTAVFEELDPSLEAFGTVITVPVTAGIRISI